MANIVKNVIKQFNIVEIYFQQRDGKGNLKGPKLYLIDQKGLEPTESVEQSEIPVVSNIMIREDMTSPSIYGSLDIIDRNKIIENLKLSPLDLLYITVKEKTTYKEGKDPKVKNLTFSVTSVSQKSEEVVTAKIGKQVQGRVLTIEFASNEHYLLNFSYFDFMDEDFIGPISGKNGMIQYLSNKVFKEKSTPFSVSKKDINADETGNYVWLKKNFSFYPWSKPTYPPRLSSFIQMLTENAVDKNNENAVNFMFWQDLDGWNFKSIESIIQNTKEPEVYSISILPDDARAILSMNFVVDDNPETDFFELLNDGSFGSNYLFVEPKYQQDPYARYLDTAGSLEMKEIQYDYVKDYDKWSKIESTPILADSEYIQTWTHNRIYDQMYGFFEPNFFNRKKSVSWEYYGYTYSNRTENTLWQTVFDITDMDGEILRKIQKEIKQPLAKARQEYARKMNLKERWKVYKCSVCCAGELDEDNAELSTYEIVAAGSFTDILNYDASKVNSGTGPFEISGLTLSYDLNESPYNLSLGEFLNLEQNPELFTKYRFDLEIKRYEKMLEMLEKNIQARENRKEQYNNAINAYRSTWTSKESICVQSNCGEDNCGCPTQHPDVIQSQITAVKNDHDTLINHETALLELESPISITAIKERLEQLKQEFINLYDSYWNRRAFFFSKDIDYSFLKSGNNLLNVKSIKRLPIKGSKYESFATRKAFPGFTFKDGSTLAYEYSVDKELCSTGETANPYYDRKYSETIKSDYWESYESPISNFPYVDQNVPAKGPIWYRNWVVRYKYKEKSDYCFTKSGPDCCTGLVDACVCECGIVRDVRCNPEPGVYSGTPYCDEYGEQGVNYEFGRCEGNPFAENCTTQQTVACVGTTIFPLSICYYNYFGEITPECCDQAALFTQQFENVVQLCLSISEQIPNCSLVGNLWIEANCDSVLNGGGGSNGVTSPLTSGSSTSNCDFNRNSLSFYEATLEMHFETFSNRKDSNILRFAPYSYAEQKLEQQCKKDNSKVEQDCVEIVSIEPASDIALYHPWAADELDADFNDQNYIDYKKSSSLFKDDLENSLPPSLHLEGLESYVRVEFKNPIGLRSLEDFPDGFVNTPGSEYFLPYIVLLTAGPFGAEAAKANVSVIGQDPYGFDIAVKKTKNKNDFAKMNLFDSGADPYFENISCNVFSTAASWFRKSQNTMFYRPTTNDGDIFVPMGVQDIFTASSLQRSAPVKTWWDLWVSLPPVAVATFHNRLNIDSSKLGRVPFYKEGSIIGEPKPVIPLSDIGNYENWPIFLMPDTEMMTAGVYPGNAAIVENEYGSKEELLTGTFETVISPNSIGDGQTVSLNGEPERTLSDDPSNKTYLFGDFPNIREVDQNKIYSVISYPIGTMIYGGSGFTTGQVWKYDSSRMTEYGLVQLNSDSMPSLISLMGGVGGNIENIRKYYDWVSDKLIDWYQNTIFDNNFSAQFVVFSKEVNGSCKDYPCSNPRGFVNNSNCPSDDPLCNCPCQELRPDKITTVKDRFTGEIKKADINDFGPEPSSLELKELKEKTKECNLIREVLGEDWLGCVWDDPKSPYNCNCPCIGKHFYDYMKYNQIQSTFWGTPLKTPLFRNAQMNLLQANEIEVVVPGDLSIKTGQIIFIDGSAETDPVSKKRYHGKWLIFKIEHYMSPAEHLMRLVLVRDSNSKI